MAWINRTHEGLQMEQAELPNLSSWADKSLTLMAERSDGDVEILYTTLADQNQVISTFSDVSDQFHTLVGVLPTEGKNGAPLTLISVFHRGEKVGAICEHTVEPESEENIREIVAAILHQANRLKPITAPALDPKEIAYLKKVAEGLSDAEIADNLNLSLRAVKERKKRTQTDLRATSIAHAIAIATASGQI